MTFALNIDLTPEQMEYLHKKSRKLKLSINKYIEGLIIKDVAIFEHSVGGDKGTAEISFGPESSRDKYPRNQKG